MKVLLIYYEPSSSGQTTHVLSLARGLDRERFDLTVVLPQFLEAGIAAFRQTGARVVPLPLRKAMWPRVALLAVSRLIRGTPIDLVHVHSQEAGLIARPLASLAGAPAILYTPQTIDIRRTGWHWLYRGIERCLATITDWIISVCDSDRQRLSQWGIPAHKILTIPNGIDLGQFEGPVDRVRLRAELGLDAERPLVVQVGRLSAQKNPLALVEGAAQVIGAYPSARFALVGDGPLREAVSARIRERALESHVKLLGWRDDASRFIAAADVVSLTSRWEGSPYALLEAMAWSRPVVATAVNGCPEIVAEGVTGFLVPPDDCSAWAEKVMALLRDPTAATMMGRQGRARVEARFTLPQMIAQIETLYQKAAH